VKHPNISFRVDSGPNNAVGPGKIALLENIERSGWLSQAARDLNMSYRRAWLLLDSLNSSFVEPVTLAKMGGYGGGGGTTLTPLGRELIRLYRAFDTDIQAHAARCFGPIAPGVRKQALVVPSTRLSLNKR
jgi:molybdate transport system regulatory protein